ncbi:hypothetical protein [Pseudacidovorax sp.]|uniref:hypothetical protein n=1 Tax=Pseudacidovorax sp. TaxID=1934311 RepID=UPI0025F18B94|nr:hypothetical protein [Pseudacidovorax sp.]
MQEAREGQPDRLRAGLGGQGFGRIGADSGDHLGDARVQPPRHERLAEEELVEIGRRGGFPLAGCQQLGMGHPHAAEHGLVMHRPAALQQRWKGIGIDRLGLDHHVEDLGLRAFDAMGHVRRHHQQLARLPGAAIDAHAIRQAAGGHVHRMATQAARARRAQQPRVEDALRRQPHHALACGARCPAGVHSRVSSW